MNNSSVLRRLATYVPPEVSNAVGELSSRTGLSVSRIVGDAVSAYVSLHDASPHPDAPPFAHMDVYLTEVQHRAVIGICGLTGVDPSIVLGLLVDTVLLDKGETA